jgi:hypothetical protein
LVRGRGPLAFVIALGAGSVVSCTFLVSFDEIGDATCGAGPCDGAPDATFGPDANELGDDSLFPGDDSDLSADVGDCSVLSEGEPCAKPDACRATSTCHDGVCTAHPLKDGTVCGTVPDVCHDAPACASGVCAAAEATPDGTACGATPDACHDAPACANGACAAAAEKANGTTCGSAPDTCHDARKCSGGTCDAAATFAEGALPTGGGAHERCCGGKAVDTSTDKSNCGVCGIVCSGSQSCSLLDGQYLCEGCGTNPSCWSGCCSLDPAPDHCSPSNCSGACQSPDICPGGSHCVVGTSIDYCTY